MATYGVIGDVHGNLEALHAVLAQLTLEGVDRIVGLGDLVGYNAGSNECVELIRARGIDCIAGNHDLIALGQLGFDRCAMRPEFTLRQTRRELEAATRHFLASLPPMRVYEDSIVLVHGGMEDVCEYMRTPADITRNAAILRLRLPHARLCLFGHTHVPRIYEVGPGEAISQPIGPSKVDLDPTQLHFINPGSVDAARRPEKVAEFAIVDSARWTVRHLQIPYDDVRAERSATLAHYRMSRLDETLYGARRLAKRGSKKAARLVRSAVNAVRRRPEPRSPPR